MNDWYENTLLSRLNNKTAGCIIIVMQRLHQDDLVGHVLQQDGWERAVLRGDRRRARTGIPFPTPYGERRISSEAAGAALHPERGARP